jgi:hypothetical protein
MLPLVERLLPTSWRYYINRVYYFWTSRLAFLTIRASPPPLYPRPLTDSQHKQKADEFIDSIDTEAIRALASKYNGGLSCNIRCRCQGSFNVCYILDFSDGTTRLVRLPIEPAVHDVWDKVRSEVYTMQ